MKQSTQVLSEALNRLINAYEELQKENSKLNNKIKELEDDNLDLQQKIEDLSDTTDKQTEDITSMLGKIESLFTGNVTNSSGVENVTQKQEPRELFDDLETNTIVETVQDEFGNESEEEISTAKIDLQRMENLLSGFGGNR
jgi:chromosome segregation ATPase